jgi:hypothetical protein
MVYVFDTSSFLEMRSISRKTFISFWNDFEQAIDDGLVISVREVERELANRKEESTAGLLKWLKKEKVIFPKPTPEETAFVRKIFQVKHFQGMIKAQERLAAGPFADPFLIAAAGVRKGCVVTQEHRPPNGAKIPNVCHYFGIPCLNLEAFLDQFGRIY